MTERDKLKSALMDANQMIKQLSDTIISQKNVLEAVAKKDFFRTQYEKLRATFTELDSKYSNKVNALKEFYRKILLDTDMTLLQKIEADVKVSLRESVNKLLWRRSLNNNLPTSEKENLKSNIKSTFELLSNIIGDIEVDTSDLPQLSNKNNFLTSAETILSRIQRLNAEMPKLGKNVYLEFNELTSQLIKDAEIRLMAGETALQSRNHAINTPQTIPNVLSISEPAFKETVKAADMKTKMVEPVDNRKASEVESPDQVNIQNNSNALTSYKRTSMKGNERLSTTKAQKHKEAPQQSRLNVINEGPFKQFQSQISNSQITFNRTGKTGRLQSLDSAPSKTTTLFNTAAQVMNYRKNPSILRQGSQSRPLFQTSFDSNRSNIVTIQTPNEGHSNIRSEPGRTTKEGNELVQLVSVTPSIQNDHLQPSSKSINNEETKSSSNDTPSKKRIVLYNPERNGPHNFLGLSQNPELQKQEKAPSFGLSNMVARNPFSHLSKNPPLLNWKLPEKQGVSKSQPSNNTNQVKPPGSTEKNINTTLPH